MYSNKEKKVKHIVAYSGGKDSTAMLFRMIELKMPIDHIVFANTTLEFPEMYEFIKKIDKITQERIGVPITQVNPKKKWEELFFGKVTRGSRKGLIRGWPLAYYHGWCCRDFKVMPQRDFSPATDKGNVVYLGIAFDEQRRQQKEPGFRYPLIEWGWTEKKCFEYIKEQGVYNPLYDDFARTGCWLCPKQPKKSLKVLHDKYPHLWKYMLELEERSGMPFHPRYTIKELSEEFKNN